MTKQGGRSCCQPADFQKGDLVRLPDGTKAVVTAVGRMIIDGKTFEIVYRVGRNQYWLYWQLRRDSKP